MRRGLFKRNILDRFDMAVDEPEQWKIKLLRGAVNDIDKFTRVDFLSYLPDDILVKVDRASMLNSLEIRAPWLDCRIIEFAFKKVHPKYKISNGVSRLLQRRLAERVLPKIFDLDRKQGFSIPVSNLRNVVQPVLSENNIGCVFPSLFLERCINGLTNGSCRAAGNYTRFLHCRCSDYL